MQVEVDLVTGRTEIIRSDIIYDCGKSLNPAVDLGQVIRLILVRILDVHLMFYNRLVNWRLCLFSLRRLKERLFKESDFSCMRSTRQMKTGL